MLTDILSTIHNITTMLFGIYISSFFLGVKQNRKNVSLLLLFSACEAIPYIVLHLLFGSTFSLQIYPMIYPFIIHLPLILLLVFYYKYPLFSSLISVTSAYLCCQISNWMGLFVFSLTGIEWCYYLSRIITTLIVFFLLCRFVCRTTATVFATDRQKLSIISFFPFIYYIFDYISTKFSSLLYSHNDTIVEFMGFAFCIAYLIFLLIYFGEHEQVQEARQYNELMEMQLLSIQKEIEQVKSSEQTLSILRHDMRHHMNIILTQIQNGDTDKVISYIQKINNAYDNTIVPRYCKSDMLNSILSIYQMRFKNKGLVLNCDITCDSIPFSEIAFCAILSNALENSMHALEDMNMENRWANLTIFNKDNSLLLRLENPTAHTPVFIDGIPVSNKKNHGIGVKSIVYYTEQLNGQWHFSISNNRFVVKIII